MVCEKCGTEYSDIDVSCPVCGIAVNKPFSSPVTAEKNCRFTDSLLFAVIYHYLNHVKNVVFVFFRQCFKHFSEL